MTRRREEIAASCSESAFSVLVFGGRCTRAHGPPMGIEPTPAVPLVPPIQGSGWSELQNVECVDGIEGSPERCRGADATLHRDVWVREWETDPRATLTAAYRSHSEVVRSRARSICGPDLAADVVQEVFLRLWQAPERFDPARASLRTYLLVVTRSVAIDLVRSDHRRRQRDERAEHGSIAVGHDEDELLRTMTLDEARARVTQALSLLAGGTRGTIRIIYFDELTFGESARRSGIPEATIKSRVKSGVHQLRPLLADLSHRDLDHRDLAGEATSTTSPEESCPVPTHAFPPTDQRTGTSIRRRRSDRLAAAIAGLTVAATIASGCSQGTDSTAEAGSASGASSERITIVSTVAPITSIVANIVGDLADVVGIVPEGTNSHTYEPRPSVAEQLETADVVYMNGLKLEEPTKRLAEETIDDDAEIVELGSATIAPDEYLYDFSFPESGGKPNPHLWTDPTLARRYAEIVKDDMSARDPRNAAAYAANFEAFSAVIDEFDTAMRTAFATVPVPRVADLPRRVRLLRRDLRLEGDRRDPGRRLRGPDAPRGRRPDRTGA